MSDDWQVGKEKKTGIAKEIEYAVIIGVVDKTQTEDQVEEYLDELEFLALTAGAVIKKRVVQKLPHRDVRTYLGSGKIQEVADYIEFHEDITMAIFDDDLTGKQTEILEEFLKVKIIDRSTLILDIFASRAQTAQAKTQVEMAQMKYLLPRLRGLWTHLERQRGGIGMRGPGEQEIETDRRIIRDKIAHLKTKLAKIDQQALTQRKNRGDMIRVALVGYTNVGKSTLMNLLSKSEVFAEDKLFATLDTTVRKVVFETMPFLLSDTVGFIRKLPHHLIESFKSTLDELKESDIILHVVDMAHPQFEDHIQTVMSTIKDLGVIDKPTRMVFNKLDLYIERNFDDLLDQETKDNILAELKNNISSRYDNPVSFMSAIEKTGLDDFREELRIMIVDQYEIRYPYRAKTW